MEWVGGGPLLHDREKIIKQIVQVTLTTNQRLDINENNDIQTLVSFINIIIYEYHNNHAFCIYNICLYLSYIIIDITKLSTPCALLKGIGGSCPNGELCDDTYGIAKCVYVLTF